MSPQEKRVFIKTRVVAMCRHFDRINNSELESRYLTVINEASDNTVQEWFNSYFKHLCNNKTW